MVEHEDEFQAAEPELEAEHGDEFQTPEPEQETAQVPEVEVSPAPAEMPSLWQRLRRLFTRGERLERLNWAISAYPDAPANYVLRGELLLEHGETNQAADDFLRALELAEEQIETNAWGVLAQAMQDRARVGLRDALARGARYNPNTDQTDSQ